jgi:hypothetical protein
MTPVAAVTERTFREAVAGSRLRRQAREARELRCEADRLEAQRRHVGPDVRAALAVTVISLHDKARRLESA